MRAIFFLAAIAAAVPAVAGAQDATERRRFQAYENLRQLEQNQRIGEVERQVSNMEIRRQSDDTLRALQNAPRVNTVTIAPPPQVTRGAKSPEDIARDAELAASNERLRALAQAQRTN